MTRLGADDVIERFDRFGLGERLHVGPRLQAFLQAGQGVHGADQHDARRHRRTSVPRRTIGRCRPIRSPCTARGLVKRYGDVVAVNGLDLQVVRGECFGLLGPNGAGKTTTIEILEGLLHADAGEVTVLGRRWDREAAALRPRLGIQLQETQLADKLTVRETLRLFRSFYPRRPRRSTS